METKKCPVCGGTMVKMKFEDADGKICEEWVCTMGPLCRLDAWEDKDD